MASKSENEHRKLLRRKAGQAALAEEEARMPVSRTDLAELFDYLDSSLSAGCDHTMRHTRAFLRARNLPEEKSVAWLGEYGGFCDCEVIANVADRWE
jgi:hypothetical protein